MNLSQLQYFVKLAEEEHYSRAAKELYITQPSLTYAIKSLEAELGVSLFERTGRTVRLTQVGADFRDYVDRGLQEIEKGVDFVREYTSSLAGEIKIGAIFTVQGDYLPSLIKDYHEASGSEVVFHMFQGFTMQLVEDLERDAYDVVFAARVPNKPELCFDRVVSHELVVGVSKSSPLADRTILSLEDLQGKNIITYRRGTPIGEEVNDVLLEGNLQAEQQYEDEITLGGMVCADPTICGLMTLSIGLKSFPDMAIIPLSDIPREFHNIYMVYKKDAFRSRAVESFLEFTHDYEPPEGVIPSTRRL